MELRKGLPPLPPRIARLPIDPERGYPVPYFVSWVEGKPDFRIADGRKFAECIEKGLCWICGEPLGKWLIFSVGPMCTVNRVSSEPPAHRECADFSVKACPFLTMPKMVRREGDKPDEARNPGGVMICRNPGVTALWQTQTYRLERVHNGVLIIMGDPVVVEWYAEGRPATLIEVEASFDSGLPALTSAIAGQKLTEAMKRRAYADLEKEVAAARKYFPKITHVVYDGGPLCAFTDLTVSDWPLCHNWVVRAYAEKSNCPQCRTIATAHGWIVEEEICPA